MLAAISGVVIAVSSHTMRVFHRNGVILIEVLEGAFFAELSLALEAVQLGRVEQT